jgi:hypothetical protein
VPEPAKCARKYGLSYAARPGVDLALLLFPSLAFGLLVTAQVALVALLVTRQPRWRSLLALLIPPLAPYWGWLEGFRIWSALWLAALVLYVVGFAIAGGGA